MRKREGERRKKEKEAEMLTLLLGVGGTLILGIVLEDAGLSDLPWRR